MPDELEEIPLEGGNVTAGVVRVGDTVRRPLTPASGLAHAVLRHLQAVGFPHSPRLLGLDDRGREILSFAPGHTIWPHEPELLYDGRAIEPIGALVRSFHDAMAGFPSSMSDGSIVLHGDLAPWNVVVGEDGTWTLIDWDAVAQGRPETELAYVLHTFVPLWPNTPFADDDAEVVRRVERFAAAYGADRGLIDAALGAVPDRCRWLADETERRAAAGEASFGVLVSDGHPQVWRDGAEHVASRLPPLARPVTVEPDELQLLARRRWPRGRHPGGLGWERATSQLPEIVAVVRRADGSVAGWAGVDPPGGLTVEADDDVAAEVLGRAVEAAPGEVLEVNVAESDAALRAAVEAAGFRPGDPWTGMWRAASPDDRPGAVAGCTLRSMGERPSAVDGSLVDSWGADERAARVEVHRGAWRPADLPWHPDHRPPTPADAVSSFDDGAFGRVEGTWLYDRSLDLVASAGDGELVGCCTVWFDPVLGVAEIEPLGVVPSFRRLGLAGALCLEASARVAERGGHEVFLNAGPRPAYPASAAAYAKAGFEVRLRGAVWSLRR